MPGDLILSVAVSGRILTSLPVFDNARRSHIVCSVVGLSVRFIVIAMFWSEKSSKLSKEVDMH